MLSKRFYCWNHEFKFECKISFLILWLSFAIIFCFLGKWQLYRYHFKQNLLADYQERSTALPQDFKKLILKEKDLQFQRIKTEGKYLNDLTMFIQNRYYQDKLGFEVLTPFKIDGSEKLLLIDRGWVEKKSLVSLSKATASETQYVIGNIKLLNEYQFILGNNILEPEVKPLVLQKIDLYEIESVIHQNFYPFVLRLDAKDKNGFIRDWTITAVNPERHLGYAVQWFLMAIALVIAFFNFCIEKVRPSHATN